MSTKIEQYTVMRFMIGDTCEIIDFVSGGNINKTEILILTLIYFHYIHRFRKIVAKFLERYMKPVEAIDPEHVRGISQYFSSEIPSRVLIVA